MVANNNDKLKYAWEWFKYHAQQRAQIFNYFLIITGALLYGLTSDTNGDYNQIIAILGVVVSLAFYFLEKRNEELVNCGRDALKDNRFKPYLSDFNREHLTPNCLKDCPIYMFITLHSCWFKLIIVLTGIVWLIDLYCIRNGQNINNIICQKETLWLVGSITLIFIAWGSVYQYILHKKKRKIRKYRR